MATGAGQAIPLGRTAPHKSISTANTDSWTADKHSYEWKVDDDIYYVADFAVLSTGAEIYISGSGTPDLEGKLGLK